MAGSRKIKENLGYMHPCARKLAALLTRKPEGDFFPRSLAIPRGFLLSHRKLPCSVLPSLILSLRASLFTREGGKDHRPRGGEGQRPVCSRLLNSYEVTEHSHRSESCEPWDSVVRPSIAGHKGQGESRCCQALPWLLRALSPWGSHPYPGTFLPNPHPSPRTV